MSMHPRFIWVTYKNADAWTMPLDDSGSSGLMIELKNCVLKNHPERILVQVDHDHTGSRVAALLLLLWNRSWKSDAGEHQSCGEQGGGKGISEFSYELRVW